MEVQFIFPAGSHSVEQLTALRRINKIRDEELVRETEKLKQTFCSVPQLGLVQNSWAKFIK